MRSAWRFVAPVALVILVLLVFMPALDASIVDWDDDDLLVFNTRYRTLDAESLRWMFTTSFAGHFHPLTWLSYSLDWVLWKREWFGYHLTSVLLHAATAVAFYFVMRRLLARALRIESAIYSAPVVWSAALAAGLFAFHPLRAESVAWLAARSGLIGGLFYVIGVGCYLRYADEPDHNPVGRSVLSRRLFYVASVVSGVLSLLAKATAITLPLVLLILDAYPLRRWSRRGGIAGVKGRFREESAGSAHAQDAGDACLPARSGRSSGGIWFDKLPFFAISLLFAVRAMIARQEGGALYTLAEHDIPARLAQACYGVAFYLWKTLWPTNLGPLYEIPSREVLLGPMLWGSAAVVAVVLLAALGWRRRFPAILAALSVYIVVLLPVLGFAQSGPQLVADRYSYIPCLGLAALGGALFLRWLRADFMEGRPNRRAALGLATVALTAGLGQMTFRQSDLWLSALTLWRHGVEVSPDSPVAHTNYADVLVRIEAFEDAERHYRRAIELNPQDVVALHHYADLLARAGYRDAAIDHYLRSLGIDPSRRRACASLARLLTQEDRAHEAIKVLRDGAARHPDALDMIDHLAQLLSTHPEDTVRNGAEAVTWARRLSQAYNDDNAAALLTLATAYAEAGRFKDAVDAAERGLTLANGNGDERLASELERRLALFRSGKPYHFPE